MEKFKISDCANLLKVSQQTVYKKVKKLKKELAGHSFKEKGSLFLDSEGVEIIRASISTAPEETTMEAALTAPFNPVLNTPDSRLGDIEKGVLALTEAFRTETKKQSEAMARLSDENRALRMELLKLRVLLPAPQVPAKKEETFWQGFHRNVLEVQEWIRGVINPFVEPFRG